MNPKITLTVAAAAISIAGSHPCDAALPVLDLSNLGQQIKNYALQLQGVKTAVDTFNTATGILHEAQQTTQEVMSVYNAVSHVTDLGSAIGALGYLGIQDPLPISVYSMQSVFNSRGNIGGLLNTLGNFGTNYSRNAEQNTLFTWLDPLGQKPMTERINATSAAQGAGETLFNASQQRMPLIRGLVDRLNNYKDPAEREALTARLVGEQVLTQAATNEAVAAQMMATAAKDAAGEREEQLRAKGQYQAIDNMKAATGTW
jgi:hypothetical protein